MLNSYVCNYHNCVTCSVIQRIHDPQTVICLHEWDLMGDPFVEQKTDPTYISGGIHVMSSYGVCKGFCQNIF